MEQRKCRYFLTIAEEKNISKAAKRLYISQPSLSKFLTGLGVRLFVRNRNVLEITEAGNIFLRYARKAIRLEEQMNRELEEWKGERETKLSLGITPWISAYVTSPIIQEFSRLHPQVRLDIVEDFGENLFSMFLDQELDFVLSNITEKVRDKLPPDGEYMPVIPDRLLLIAPKSISEKYGIHAGETSAMHPYMLEEIPFVGCNIITGKPHQHLYTIIGNIIETYGLKPRSVIESQNTDNCIHLVDSGHGISFVSEIYVRDSRDLEHSDIFAVDSSAFEYTRFVIYDRSVQTPERKDLIRVIQKVCGRVAPLSGQPSLK